MSNNIVGGGKSCPPDKSTRKLPDPALRPLPGFSSFSRMPAVPDPEQYMHTVDFIRLENSHRYRSMDEAVGNSISMFPDPTGPERRKLEKYVRSVAVTGEDGIVTLHPRHVTTWAFIRWDPGIRRP